MYRGVSALAWATHRPHGRQYRDASPSPQAPRPRNTHRHPPSRSSRLSCRPSADRRGSRADASSVIRKCFAGSIRTMAQARALTRAVRKPREAINLPVGGSLMHDFRLDPWDNEKNHQPRQRKLHQQGVKSRKLPMAGEYLVGVIKGPRLQQTDLATYVGTVTVISPSCDDRGRRLPVRLLDIRWRHKVPGGITIPYMKRGQSDAKKQLNGGWAAL